CMQVLQTPNSF
nr:immunoglobulin light chain junction region [Macaca mulatta]